MTTRGAWILGVALAALVSGCPRGPEAPDPGMGMECEQLSDCNPDRSCGELTLCVDGFCAQEATLVRPCEGEGEPVRPPGG